MLRRDPIKTIRDKARLKYPKSDECEICGSKKDLDFHHYFSLTELFNKWIEKKGYKADSTDNITSYRDEFISEHQYELNEAAVTLCKKHHKMLHDLYGLKPAIHTAEKQKNWVEKKKIKNGLV